MLVSPRALLAADRTKLRVKLNWIPNSQYAGEWLAADGGYFEKEGLDVTFDAGGPNTPQAVVAVSGGSSDIGYSGWFPFLDALVQGNPMVAIAASEPKSPLGILSLARKPILKPADLVKSKILIQGANQRAAVEATLSLNGLPNDYVAVPAGFSPEPLLAGQGDGYTGFSTNEVVAVEKTGLKLGKDFFFVSFDDLGYKSYGAVLFCTRTFLTNNRPAVVGYVRAIIQGWRKNDERPEEGARLAVERFGRDYGLDLAQERVMNERHIPLTKANDNRKLLALDLNEMSGPMYAAARATGRKNLPNPDTIADFAVVDEAHAKL